jgi:putative transposase
MALIVHASAVSWSGDIAMRTGRTKVELLLTDEERSQLQAFARSRSLPAVLSNRAHIILSSTEREANNSIAGRLKLTNATVGKWRARFIERRIPGLYDDVRPGKPRTIEDERVAQLIKTTLHTKPANGSTHWSVRTVATETGISKASVQRYFQLFGVQPHRTEGFKLSNDPFFVEKLRDVVGLYLSPPDNALVTCVDEKSQCQALERTQPMLPMGLGYVEGVTHDYKRHGTTTLFEGLNVLNGAVLVRASRVTGTRSSCRSGARSTRPCPPNWKSTALPITTPRTTAQRSRRGWRLGRAGTCTSFTDNAIRRGSFTSVKQLVQRIDHFVGAHNGNCQPFKWTATADSILEKLHPLCSRTSGTGH